MTFLALALAIPQGTITFHHPAAPLDLIVPALAQKLDRRLTVSEDLRWLCLYVRVANAQPSELLKQVAIASLGRWEVQKDGTLQLQLDKEAVARCDKKAAERRIQVYGQVLASEPQEGVQWHVYRDILKRIGAKKIASLKPRKRAVFVEFPNRLQHRLAPIDPAWARRLIDDRNQQVSNIGNDTAMRDLYKKYLSAEAFEAYEESRLSNIYGRIERPAMTVLVSVRPSEGMVDGDIRLYDAQGRLLGEWNADLCPFNMVETTGQQPQAPAGKKYEPSEESKKLQQLVAQYDDGKPIPEEPLRILRAAFGTPATSDPELRSVTEVLNAYAADHKGNIVTYFGHGEILPSSRYYLSGGGTAEKLGEAMEDGLPDPEGWIVSSPSIWKKPMDRGLFQEAVRRFSEPDGASIENQSWLLAKSYPFDRQPWGYEYTYIYDIPNYGFQRGYVFYGHLTEAQKRAAWSGGELAYLSLSPRQREILEYDLYEGIGRLGEPGFGPLTPDNRLIVHDMNARFIANREFNKVFYGIAAEPTLAFESGLPRETVVRFESTLEDRVSFEEWERTGEGMKTGNPLAQIVRGEAINYPNSGYPQAALVFPSRSLRMTVQTASGMGAQDELLEIFRSKTVKKNLADWPEYQNSLRDLIKAYEPWRDFYRERREVIARRRKADPPLAAL